MHAYQFLPHILQALSLFLHILTIFAIKTPADYSRTDRIAISCGSTGNLTAPDGLVWVGDSGFGSSLPLEINGKSGKSKIINYQLLQNPDPYKTARISRDEFSFVFSVKPGQKFIRLHFYQDSYKGFKKSTPLFTVKAGPYTLLSNFSTSLASGEKLIIKEYCVNVEENQALTVTFSPAQKSRKSDDFYAFINGIEVVSMPTGLYFTPEGELGARVVGHKYRFYIDNNTALETVQRLNIGGSAIAPAEDSSMFRRWNEDSNYLLEAHAVPVSSMVTVGYQGGSTYAVPIKVYQTARIVYADDKSNPDNLTWKIPVDLGFRYLIRLHYSELREGSGNKEFAIVINNQIVEC